MMERTTLAEYQDALRDLLWCVMHHSRPRGAKSQGIECRVAWGLPQLVDIAASLPSEPVAQHEAIQTQICSRCEYQDANGYCPLRMSGECCLSREEGRVIAVIRRLSQRQHVALDTTDPGHPGPSPRDS